MSLARRFLIANLVVVVLASLGVAAWVGIELEKGVLERTAGVTALYIESFVEPELETLASNGSLPAGNVDALDGLLSSTQLGERVVSFKVWTPDGTIVYSPHRELIGRSFEAEGGLARALAGDVSAEMSDLSGPENSYERARWSRLLETYVPVRERGGGRIIAVTEFYQLPDEIDAEVASARLGSWAVVALVAMLSYLLLAGSSRAAATRSSASSARCARASRSSGSSSFRTRRSIVASDERPTARPPSTRPASAGSGATSTTARPRPCRSPSFGWTSSTGRGSSATPSRVPSATSGSSHRACDRPRSTT